MEVVSPPEDTVGCLKFSPEIIGGHEYLLSGDWTNAVSEYNIYLIYPFEYIYIYIYIIILPVLLSG